MLQHLSGLNRIIFARERAYAHTTAKDYFRHLSKNTYNQAERISVKETSIERRHQRHIKIDREPHTISIVIVHYFLIPNLQSHTHSRILAFTFSHIMSENAFAMRFYTLHNLWEPKNLRNSALRNTWFSEFKWLHLVCARTLSNYTLSMYCI